MVEGIFRRLACFEFSCNNYRMLEVFIPPSDLNLQQANTHYCSGHPNIRMSLLASDRNQLKRVSGKPTSRVILDRSNGTLTPEDAIEEPKAAILQVPLNGLTGMT
jgi:hypothetical protein